MKIGFFGGTFDPVHIEHIQICLNAKQELNLDKIIVMPSGTPPHKFKMTGKEHRFNMASLAFSGINFIEIDDYEINKEDKSFTYETLSYLKEKFPADELFLIIGSDNLNEFYAWKNPEIILNTARMVVSQRIGNKTAKSTIDDFIRKYNHTPIILQQYGSNVSSTQMRAFLEFRLEDDYMPQKVYEYIVKNDLYHERKDFIGKIKGYLTEKRYRHTAYMVGEAIKIGVWQKIDLNKVFIAAALHDIAKKFSADELESFGYKIGYYPKKVEHAFAGRYIARRDFEIVDEDIFHINARPSAESLFR